MGTLQFNEERPVFRLSAKGFGIAGILGWNIPLYAADSVLLLLESINRLYKTSPEFLQALGKVAQDCARAFSGRAIIGMNQELLALKSVSEHIAREHDMGRLANEYRKLSPEKQEEAAERSIAELESRGNYNPAQVAYVREHWRALLYEDDPVKWQELVELGD